MNQLGLFAKYWRPGAVKTRLAAKVGADAAARLCRSFVETITQRFSDVADRRRLYYTPSDSATPFRSVAPEGWSLHPQCEGDLGLRMQDYFDESFADGAHKILLIGVDSPNLPRSILDQAFSALDEHPVVLGPCDDGGYYLVGAKSQTPPIFREVEWSSTRVWAQTRQLLSSAGLSFFTLPQWYDVDELEDLKRLHSQLADRQDASLGELQFTVAAELSRYEDELLRCNDA